MKYAKLLLFTGFLLIAVNSTLATGPLFYARMDYIAGLYVYPGRPFLAADFNGDSHDDLAIGTAFEEVGQTFIYLNNGDGTFQPPEGPGYYTPIPKSFFSADFDGDGDNDLAVGASTQLSSGFVYILLNNGDGTFQQGDVYLIGHSTPVVSIYSVDFDGDNDFDIAAACSPIQNPDYIAIMFNNGDGTFSPPVNYEIGQDPVEITSADLDADGDYDLAVAIVSFDPGLVSVLLNNGDGTFQSPVSYSVGNTPFNSLISADFDTDGDFDLAGGRSDSVCILMNNGNGTFQPAINYSSGATVQAITAADFEGDNDLDLAVTHGDNSGNISILLNHGNGAFQDPINHPVGVSGHLIASGIFDTDQYIDLAIEDSYISILFNNHDAAFRMPSDYPAGNGANSVFSIDFNNDTHPDLAVTNYLSNDLSILLNCGDGTFPGPANYGVGDAPVSVFSADFDGDQDNDLAVVNNGSDDISILLNNGDATFQNSIFYNVGIDPISIYSSDLDNDSDFDLAVSNEGADNISILLNNGDATFQLSDIYAVGSEPRSIFMADFDGDNYHDIAVGSGNSRNFSILINNGNGTFQPAVNYGMQNYAWCMFVADFDGDNDYDIVTTGPAIFNIHVFSILFNNGDGTFQSAVAYNPRIPYYSVFSEDFDGDNDYDLAFGSGGTVWIHPNNGDGTFVEVGIGYGPGSSSMYGIDLDTDGDVDIATAGGNVSILMNLSVTTDIRFDEIPVSNKFSLYSYPNPFNALTNISYDLPKSCDVTIEIYDILGRKIQALTPRLQQAGRHSIVWDADGCSSGIYFYRIQAGERTDTKKMLLLK